MQSYDLLSMKFMSKLIALSWAVMDVMPIRFVGGTKKNHEPLCQFMRLISHWFIQLDQHMFQMQSVKKQTNREHMTTVHFDLNFLYVCTFNYMLDRNSVKHMKNLFVYRATAAEKKKIETNPSQIKSVVHT